MEGLFPSIHANQSQHYYTLENLLHFQSLGLNVFNHPWKYQLCISSYSIISSNSVHVSGGTGNWSIQNSYSRFALLDEGFWFLTILKFLESILHW